MNYATFIQEPRPRGPRIAGAIAQEPRPRGRRIAALAALVVGGALAGAALSIRRAPSKVVLSVQDPYAKAYKDANCDDVLAAKHQDAAMVDNCEYLKNPPDTTQPKGKVIENKRVHNSGGLMVIGGDLGADEPDGIYRQVQDADSSGDKATSKRLFGVAGRGGGFRAMTHAMGVARAIGDDWQSVTHLGGTSGGYWFASQMVYSKEFYESMLDESVPISTVIADWGKAFATEQNKAIADGEFWTTGPKQDSGLSVLCKPVVALIDGVFNKASKAGWPVAPFFTAYVEHMMLPTIDDIASARVDTREKTGLSTVTLIAQTSVPPKAYLDSAKRLATREVAYDGAIDQELVKQALLPAALVIPAGGNGSSIWRANQKLGPFISTVPGEAPREILHKNPFLIEIAAASSADGGFTAVPDWGANKLVNDLANAGVELSGSEKLALKECAPWGLESMGTPSISSDFEGPADADTEAAADELDSATTFRFIDGGYLDDQGAAATLAEMQKDAAPGDGLKLLLVTQDNYSTAPLFAGVGIPANTVDVRDEYGGYPVPGQQIFAEPYPGREDTWSVYANATVPTAVASTYWRGVLTTVDNEWYDTRAGSTVDVLILSSNIPAALAPSSAPANLTATLCETVYGPLAAAQAEGAAPIIQDWLAGNLPETSA